VTITHYTLRPSFRAALVSFFVHHNPFYLLSALCMLAGCYALNSGLAPRTGDLGKLLGLVGILNAYEAMLIALGLYLIRRRGILRDGRTLLLLEAPFLVDLAFLNAEVGSVSVRLGLLLNSIVLTLALIKTAAVMHALWGRVPRRMFGFIALELSVLFLLPTAFTRFEHHGDVTPAQFYGAWWIVGALLSVYELQSRFLGDAPGPVEGGVRLFIGRLYVVLPLASLILHLSLLHWVYRVPFLRGDLSPVLIGFAFVLGRSSRRAKGEIRLLRLVLPAAAVMLALESSPNIDFSLIPRLSLTAVTLTLAAAYVCYVYSFFFKYAARMLVGAAGLVFVAAFGPSMDQISYSVEWACERIANFVNWLYGRSAIEWGLTAMACAFAFLGLGASISLKKTPAIGPVIEAPPQ
jgi:hypothetical protein